MDAARDVEVQENERLRQGILHTSKMLERDVERLQEVARDRAARARDALRAPLYVMRHPLAACALAALVGFVVSGVRSRRQRGAAGDIAGDVVPRSKLPAVGLAVVARVFESILTRGFRL